MYPTGGASLAWLLPLFAMLPLLAACTPRYNWRDVDGPGGAYRVHLPSRPATMTRQIHIRGLPVAMTMQGARVDENAFTVGMMQLDGGQQRFEQRPERPLEQRPDQAPEQILLAMREQMLRNIGASPATPARDARIDRVDADGRKTGTIRAQAISASGTGKYAKLQLQARFVLWKGHALQIVAIGPTMEPEESSHFIESLRLVEE